MFCRCCLRKDSHAKLIIIVSHPGKPYVHAFIASHFAFTYNFYYCLLLMNTASPDINYVLITKLLVYDFLLFRKSGSGNMQVVRKHGVCSTENHYKYQYNKINIMHIIPYLNMGRK